MKTLTRPWFNPTIVCGAGLLLSLILPLQAQNTFTNGLKAYWNFDKSTFVDSVGIYDGTALGTVPIPFVPGKTNSDGRTNFFGQAIHLNGADQKVQIQAGDPDDLAFAGGSVSISAWFTVDAFDKSWQALIAKGEGSNWRVARNSTSDNMSYAGGLGDVTTTKNVNDGNWHHLVAISDAAGTAWGAALYIDGELAGSQPGTAALVSNGQMMLIGDNPGSTGRTWNGAVDDVAIWNRVLTEAEINQLWNAGNGDTVSVLTGPSSVGDGIPDGWKLMYGLNPHDPTVATNDANGNGISNLQEFQRGLDPTDTNKPVLVSAAADSSFTKVIVTFSKKLDASTATNLANYAISPSLTISNATVAANVVTLTTAPQPPGATAYTLTVSNVKDINNWTVATNSKAIFYSYLLVKTGINSGLQAYWTFEGDLKDKAGHFDGTGNGSNPIGYVPGMNTSFGQALQLDGVDQYVQITGGNPGDLAFANGSVSIATWFKVDSFDKSWQALVAQGENNNWRVARNGTGDTMSYAGGLTDVTTTKNVNDGNWHHLVAISDSSGAAWGAALYIDGALDGSQPGKAALTSNGLRTMIGNNPDSTARSWTGEIDDLAIWNRVLVPAEITNMYNGGTGKPISQLLTNAIDVPFPPDGKYVTQVPGPGAVNVFVETALTIAHQDGKTPWTAANVTLMLDGVLVTPTYTKTNDVLTIKYQPSSWLTGNAKHSITVNYRDPGGNPTSATWFFTTYGNNGVTKDTVKAYPGSILGHAQYTPDKGGATGKAGDYGMDLTTKGGPVLVNDPAFLTALNAATTNDELSVSFWVKKYDIAQGSAIWFSSPTQTRVYQAHVPYSDDIVYFDTAGCCDTGTQRISANINSFVGYTPDDTWWTNWHQFTFTKKADQKNIYIDGLVFLNGSSTAKLSTDINQFSIGSDNTISAGLFHAIVDDVAVYGKELSQANVTALFSGTKPSALPSTVGLIAYWDFNDASKPLPALTFTYKGGVLTLTYTGTLVSSTALTGPWTAVTGATSPYPVTPSPATPHLYYRAQQ